MSLLHKFSSYITKQNLFTKNDQLIIAVSGGVDSVVLCELCSTAGFHFKIAHCNFQLRGQESERDETFVKSLGEKYNVQVFLRKFDTGQYATGHKVSIQVAARALRYEWFEELVNNEAVSQSNSNAGKNNNEVFLLTAHHANDNVETMLMNVFKGTGITGLKGIEPRKGKIIRPLLFAKKEELQKFASENNLTYVEDSSNLSNKYTRNFFRNELIPAVQKVFPEAEENLMSNLERFRDIEVLYSQAIDVHKKKLMEKKGNEIHIPVLKLLKSKPLPTIVYEIIKDFGFTPHQTEEVIKLLNSETGKYISSGSHRILKNRNWLIIAPHSSLEASNILIDEDAKTIQFANGDLKIQRLTNDNLKISIENNIALLDADKITFPLILRRWKPGDYFYPLGMKKKSGSLSKKKLSKFFIDQKMSLTEKEKVWVIESNKKILWVINHRIDDRFKIISNTKEVLKFTFNAS
ncbi:MAG: tRNA lysidine(34) synthetase TilS [Ginsengibacter sp.]